MPDRTPDIDRARDAIARRSWAEAYEELHRVPLAELGPRELEGLADAAWWVSELDGSITARQHAYTAYERAGLDPEASFNAVQLCFETFDRDGPSVAMGWLMRAERHLENHEECVQHGFLALGQAAAAQGMGDLDTALARSERAAEIGRRFGSRDVLALGIHLQGQILITLGRTSEGLSLLDEAMTSVVANELSPFFTGVIYCNVLDTCLDIADLRRAGEWSDAALAWSTSLPQNGPYSGRCRISVAEVTGLRGAWADAERISLEIADAAAFDPPTAGRALYLSGEIRRKRGDHPGAEDAFARASE